MFAIMNFIISDNNSDSEIEVVESDVQEWYKDIRLYYKYNIKPKSVLKTIEKQSYSKVTPNDEYRRLGGHEITWKPNNDKLTKIFNDLEAVGSECPKCHMPSSLISLQIQKRAGDEGASVVYECINPGCRHTHTLI